MVCCVSASASSYAPASSNPYVRLVVLLTCAQTFLLSCESASALRPLRRLCCTCPACTCAEANSPQHRASAARFVKGCVSGAPLRKEGSESSPDAVGSLP